ncbi:MFS transporter [Thalassotalea sp. SU-HH00458]|uniref:MFS transporter n=1 Tax=Thalassotalea sp. SU-HH00458 TaxID=3127657 RepID=UPI0031097932
MLINIVITLALLILTTVVLSRIFSLPKNVWVLFLVQPLVMAASPVIVFIGGILSSEIAENPSLATLPVTVMILGVASAAIPAALLAKKLGRKLATYVGFSLGLLGSFIAMIATQQADFKLFTLASLFFGMSTAFIQQLRFAAIESVNDENEIPTVLSMLMLSGIFSAFLGPEIAVVAKDWLASPYGYTGSFAFIAGLNLVAMAVLLFFQNPLKVQTTQRGDARPLPEIIKQPIFIISILTAAIGFALMSYLMTATPLSMHHMHGHSLMDTKWVIQSHIAAMFIPSLFTAWLVKKIGLQQILLLGTLIYSIVTMIAFSGEQVVHYWWALLLLGIGWNFLFLTGTSLLPQSYHPWERHKVQALNDFVIFGFQAIASLLAGWMLFQAGWHGVVLSSIPFIIILYVVTWLFYRHNKNPHST